MGRHEEALEDSIVCLKLSPEFAKGYQRKGKAELNLNRLWDSFYSYSIGNLYDPSNNIIETEYLLII